MYFKSRIVSTLTLLLLASILIVSCVEKRPEFSGSATEMQTRKHDFFEGRYLPDIETFMRIGYVTNASISDDGRRIFLSPSYTNVSQIFRVTDGGWPEQLTGFEDGISWYVLSHDAYYAIVGAATGGDENAQLYLLDTESGRLEKLTDKPEVRYGGVVWTEDDQTIYFYSNEENGQDFKIYKMDLPDGEIVKVSDKPGYNGPIDVSPDETRLLTYTYYSSRNNDFFLLDLETGEEELLTPHEGDYLYTSITMMPDWQSGYVVTNNTPDGISRLARLDVATKELEFLDPDQKWECEGGGVDDSGRFLMWILNVDGYAEPYLKNLETGEMLPVPEMKGMFGFGGVTDAGKFLFTFNNANNPPNAWIWNPENSEATKVTEVSTMGIDVDKFVEPELIKVTSFDGLEVPAFLYLPPDYEKGPIPFIMDIHGGPEGQFRPTFNRHFNYLLANGFGIIAPNVRGSDGYGKEYLDMDNYKNRLNSVADAAECAKWLIDNGYTTREMIGVKGASYGGYMVMALITEYPDLFAAAWNQVGIVNFVTFLEKTADYRRAMRESEYGPLSDREFLKSISPIHKVDKIETPLMVVHGENDPRVPVYEARQIIAELKRRGGEVDSLIFSDEGHGVAKLENRLVVYRTMVDFFREHLKK